MEPTANRPDEGPNPLADGTNQPATAPPDPATAPESAVVSGGSTFAHASEAEMARILDFYGVSWRYEPVTFPILWNLEGEVVESFSPDFYLPDFDLYLEMTTLKQSLVRKKNRKLRRLRELYPDIRIKLFYARDFRAMMLKYGRLGLIESLTGTSGQLVRDSTASAVSATTLDESTADGLGSGRPTGPARATDSARRRSRRDASARSAPDVEIA